MKPNRNQPAPAAATGQVGDHAHKLSRVRPIAHDEDERQSAADRGTYHSPLQSLFEPVPLPKWLKPRRSKKLL